MKTCLIIDDSRVVRQIARRIISDLGLECAEAENGVKALNACSEAMPDVILLDWNMPVMNGIDFLEKLRGLRFGSQPRVIFCTTEGDRLSMMRALKAGADEYIIKPFNNEILKEKLAHVGMI